MFTGLIEEMGVIADIHKQGAGLQLTINADKVLEMTKIGDSIAIDGACQTVTKINDSSFTVFVSNVTSSVTTLGDMKQGDSVNLERALTPTSRLGGHMVQGHVDGIAKITAISKDSSGISIKMHAPDHLVKYIANKGSIATDGISLTIVIIENNIFSLYVIPETIKNTTIENWKVDKNVNIEVDILAKYVEKMMQNDKTDSSQNHDLKIKKKLMEEGYM